MLRITNIEEIERFLLRVPALIDELETRSPDFVSNTRAWMKDVEGALEANRLAVAGNIAGLRGLLSSADQGLIPSHLAFRGRPTRQKVLRGVSSEALREAAKLVSDALAPDRARIAEATLHCGRLVAHWQAKAILEETKSSAHAAEWLRDAWQVLSKDQALRDVAAHVEGLLGPTDVLIVLDRSVVGQDEPTAPLPAGEQGTRCRQELSST